MTVVRYTQKQHLVDVTEIYNMLKWEKKKRLFKLGYLVMLLFLSLFWYAESERLLAYETICVFLFL